MALFPETIAIVRGLKQRDPLFQSLFILAAEVLSRALNKLNGNNQFIGFSMGQEINKDKSFFLTQNFIDKRTNRRIKRWTGFNQAKFPFTYLGCPIYTGRKKVCHFSDLATKVLNKAGAWQGKLLSFGGRAIIIKHVLQSQTLYSLAAMVPPKTIIRQIEMYLSNYFWGLKEGKKRYHWSSWDNMSFPWEEGDLGFKKLQDICYSFVAKRWWTKFINAKYYPRSNPPSKVINSNDSSTWRNLLETREKIETNIHRKINKGNRLFWWDKWTLFGPIKQQANLSYKPGNNKTMEYFQNQIWNRDLLQQIVHPRVIQEVSQVHIGKQNINDQAIWTLNAQGTFTCSSVYHLLRKKRDHTPWLAKIWDKDLSFKISFNTWRILKNRLSLGYQKRRPGIMSLRQVNLLKGSGEQLDHHWDYNQAQIPS
ncbi:uncharacterized protein [Nicotiana tomentosiformis]|uniref:uncharacterized protein n=1 Tax=Nicotiana tomentosiformis TaxID=4098 RepID=UPI00051B89A4|nr:uncharacterized protein LOC104103741 [Nicotiana tomentosiformis]